MLDAGTGLRVQQALVQGVNTVSAIEPNPELVDVTCNTYRALQPDVCAQPGVRWHVQSGRAFMAASTQTFDLITLALHADTAGLDALAVDYSASRQAIASYLRRLADDGILAIEGPARVPPRLSLRVLNTARAALQFTGAGAPAEHLVMLRGWQRFILLVSKAPVDEAKRFLRGESQNVRRMYQRLMEEAAEKLEYEEAAKYRNRLWALAHVTSEQAINAQSVEEADVFAAHQEGGQTCIQVFFFRSGQNWGNRAYFPRHDKTEEIPEVLGAFLGQFYENKPAPPVILLSHKVPEMDLIAEALGVRAEAHLVAGIKLSA